MGPVGHLADDRRRRPDLVDQAGGLAGERRVLVALSNGDDLSVELTLTEVMPGLWLTEIDNVHVL